ncbi:MAG TPA: hypothetical protein ENI80_01165 [Acidiferrobacteraceae bacterium]|nr:hypothetical protein [Acidiferrobacteraceae bacterium]
MTARLPLYWAMFSFLAFLWGIPPVQAAPPWQAQVAFAGGGQQLPPQGPFRIVLPKGLDSRTLTWLALELDIIDVSTLVTMEGNTIVLVPPQPLAPGPHRLRLIQYSPNGKAIERGAWTFQVGKPQGTRQFALQGNVTLNPSYRAADDDIEPSALPGKLQGTGSAQVGVQAAGPGWQISGRADFLYNSLPDLPSGQNNNNTANLNATNPASMNEFELGEFLFTGQRGSGFINLGQHAIGSDSLIMQQFARRGLSVGTRSRDNRFYGTGFIMRTEPVIGFRYGLGVSDPNNRVAGAVFSTKPFRANPERLTLSGTYLQGQGRDQSGIGVIGNTTVGKGDAWSVTAESLLVSSRLRLRGEYAKTRFDFDGPNQGFDKEGDDAQAFLALYQPWANKLINKQPLNIQLGIEYKKIGTFFRSLANPGLPSDKKLKRVFVNANWAGLNIQSSVGREEDNVNNIRTLPRLRKEQFQLAAAYTPLPSNAQGKPGSNPKTVWRRLLGTPTYAMNIQTVRDQTISFPSIYQGGLVDSHTRAVQASANFTHQTWNWFASYYTGWQDDATNVSPDTRNDMASLGVNLRLGPRVNIGIQLQKNVINDQSNNIDTTSWLTGLNASATLIPNKLIGTLNYVNTTEEISDLSADRITQTVGFNLTWYARQARQNRPGVSIWLQGQYQDINDKVNTSQNTSPYQIFLGATVTWPTTYRATY